MFILVIVNFSKILNGLILICLTGGSHAHGVDHTQHDHGHSHHDHGTQGHGERGSHGHAHSIQDLTAGLAVLGNENLFIALVASVSVNNQLI